MTPTGLPAWLLFPVIVIVGWGIIAGVTWLVEATSDDGWGSVILALLLGGIWSLASLVMMVAITIVLALPGTRGPNRYGPEPGSEWTRQPAHSFAAAPESAVGDGDTATQTGQRYCTQMRRAVAARGAVLHPLRHGCTIEGPAGDSLSYRLRKGSEPNSCHPVRLPELRQLRRTGQPVGVLVVLRVLRGVSGRYFRGQPRMVPHAAVGMGSLHGGDGSTVVRCHSPQAPRHGQVR